MRYLGIDPGVGGGIAVLSDTGFGGLHAYKMPGTEADLLEILRPFERAGELGLVHAVLERVGPTPQMGVVSAFTFGRGFGGLRMALSACRIPFDEVTPQKWQAAMGCLSKGDKNITKRRAQALFPTLTVTHAIADALLIAEFCRRSRVGTGVHESRRQQPQGAQRNGKEEAEPGTQQETGKKGTREGQESRQETQPRRRRSDPQARPSQPGTPRHGAGSQRRPR
jgi:hypothetical protein